MAGDGIQRRLAAILSVDVVEYSRLMAEDEVGTLAALAWLANSLVKRGRMLTSGDIVLTGSMVATRWLGPGDEMTTIIDGLGEARLRIS